MTTWDLSADRLTLDGTGPAFSRVSALVGLAGLAATAILAAVSRDGASRALHAYLAAFAFYLSLSLGALCFVMSHHATRAGWGVVVRRLSEAIASGLTAVLPVLSVPVLAGATRLYPWASGAGLGDRGGWLNVPFFVARWVVYLLAWGLLTRWLLRRSVEQDRTGDPALTLRMERLSNGGLVLYAFTVTFAAFDLLMGLSPRWFSTIFGVYYFAGGFVGFLALLPLVVLALQRTGRMVRVVTPEHYHDMGKLVFAFVVFWAYIGFSQYLLVWYTNLSEETFWYARRQTAAWAPVSLLLVFGHFVVPFLLLLSRHPKRRPGVLVAVAAWVLLLHWVDLVWLAMPDWSPDRVPLGPMDLTCLVGIGGLWLAGAARWASRQALVPVRDPKLGDSMRLENA